VRSIQLSCVCRLRAHCRMLYSHAIPAEGVEMTDVQAIVADLEREIEADRKALHAKEAALELLKGRLKTGPARPVVAVQASAHIASADDELFDVSSLEVAEVSRRRTFVDDLREALARFRGQEFSIGHVEAALKRLGIEVAGKTPRSRISASLSRLNEEGFLVKTFEGGGNVPHKYRIRSHMSEDEVVRYAKLNEKRTNQGSAELKDADDDL
jgi:hypothetical protein